MVINMRGTIRGEPYDENLCMSKDVNLYEEGRTRHHIVFIYRLISSRPSTESSRGGISRLARLVKLLLLLLLLLLLPRGVRKTAQR